MRTSRVIALAFVIATFFVGQEIAIDLADGKPANIAPRVIVAVCYWLAWVLLSPLVRFAVQRWRSLPAQVAAGIVLASIQTTIEIVFQNIVRGRAIRVGGVPFIWGVCTGVIFYAIVVMVYRATALEAELTQSKLDMLRSQLRPHFLFNALNAISVFVTEDATKAQQMLLRLSALLRRSLDEQAHEVPLEQELRFVDDYLDIQRGRFGDDLIVHVTVDPSVRHAHVPVFLLQPLLENAIEHGKSDDKPTTIVLAAGRDAHRLRITLTDDGPGVGNGAPVRDGIGLRNTRARLFALYGARASVELGSANPGARVEILIPYESSDRR